MFKPLRLIFTIIAILAGFSASPKAEEAPVALHPGVSYFPLLPLDAPPDLKPQLMPIAGNRTLEGAHPGITRAIVGIHDASRNAQGVITVLSALAGANNAKTIIVAPQFLLPSDFARFYEDLPKELTDQFVSWPMDKWPTGGESYAEPPQMPISSFTALDLLLVYLAEKKYFPDMQDIVIAGHGGGANFVQLYAAIGRATNVLEKQGIHIRFLVANDPSFLYFTGSRPKPDFLGFATANEMGCPHFNDYPYGLKELNGYAQRVGANAIKTDYANRQITYLTGEGIVAADPFPDTSCMAMYEGANTVARAWNYNRYLFQIYGEDVTTKQKFYTVPKVGYDPVALFGSSCGMATLFGDGNCTPVAATSTPQGTQQ